MIAGSALGARVKGEVRRGVNGGGGMWSGPPGAGHRAGRSGCRWGQQRAGERVKSSTVGVAELIFVWRVWGFQPSLATISVSGLLRRSIQ
ncbi:hypothetical protein GA0070622_4796 [Micromonospora sediminicola]|uniref:Uncharacterized protein n=1 Tax=Micromonospora sediminicola TaxID=946078 RepID=A0A1A9BEX9_9ACTN|nr:hypothetical protein GA0070622_4796 [Micromonospora sediminicola]